MNLQQDWISFYQLSSFSAYNHFLFYALSIERVMSRNHKCSNYYDKQNITWIMTLKKSV